MRAETPFGSNTMDGVATERRINKKTPGVRPKTIFTGS